MNGHWKGVVLALLAATGYATVALFSKYVFDAGLPLFTVLAWRFGGAALCFWAWMLFKGQAKLAWKCLAIGVLGDTVQTTLFFLAVPKIGAAIAALLLYTFPFFVFLMQRFGFGKKATRREWTCLAICLTGTSLVVNPFRELPMTPEFLLGVWCALGTAVAWGSYVCLSAHITRRLPTEVATSNLTAGAGLSFLCIALMRGEFALPANGPEWLLALLIVLVATVLPTVCLIRGLKLLGPIRTSLLFTVEPVITVGLAILFFGESLTPLEVVGSLLILSAGFILEKGKQRAETVSA